MSAIERAAEAMHALGNSDPWERQHEYVRQEFRDDARAALSAAIDVAELARVIERADMQWTYTLGLGGTRHGYIARAVHTYLLTGDENDE